MPECWLRGNSIWKLLDSRQNPKGRFGLLSELRILVACAPALKLDQEKLEEIQAGYSQPLQPNPGESEAGGDIAAGCGAQLKGAREAAIWIRHGASPDSRSEAQAWAVQEYIGAEIRILSESEAWFPNSAGAAPEFVAKTKDLFADSP